MKIVALDVDGSHFVIADLNAFLIEVTIEIAGDREAVFGRGGADQLDDDLVADQRLAAPVLRDVGKETVLDPVPLAGARRQMSDRDGKTALVGEPLQLELPQTDAGAIAAATVGGDGEARGVGVARLAEPLPPAADAFDRERAGVGIDPDIDPALIGGHVVDAIGRHLAQALDLEVMDPYRFRIALSA